MFESLKRVAVSILTNSKVLAFVAITAILADTFPPGNL